MKNLKKDIIIIGLTIWKMVIFMMLPLSVTMIFVAKDSSYFYGHIFMSIFWLVVYVDEKVEQVTSRLKTHIYLTFNGVNCEEANLTDSHIN